MVEYNKHKKEELKRLNKQITKQDDMVDHKPKFNMNNYVYAGGLSVFGLAIGGYLLYQIKAVTSCSTHKIDQQETDG